MIDDDDVPFDTLLDRLAAPDEQPQIALQHLVDRWTRYAGECRDLLRAYVAGEDQSERTERALFYVTHLLGGQADGESFSNLCRLALDPDRFDSVLGDDAAVVSFPPMLLSTFAGDLAPLYRLIEHESADDIARGDALLVLAFLARTGVVSERVAYDYLAALPPRLRPAGQHFVWFGYARAVAALGFGGLTAAVEGILRRGLVDPALMTSGLFWDDLRDAQQNPRDVDGPIWDGLMPMGDPIAHLLEFTATDDDSGSEPSAGYAAQEPIRNPLRDVGRNDPCPCGSGKKHKKCCLQAA